MRTRTKSSVCRWALIDRRPLWPARPPPTFTFSRPSGRSSSSCTITSRCRSSMPKRRTSGATDSPDSFMKVCGSASATRRPSMRTSSTRARSLPLRSRPPWRSTQQIDDVEADVVAALGVLRAGVAQPDDQEVGGVPRRGSRSDDRRSAAISDVDGSTAPAVLAAFGRSAASAPPSPSAPASPSAPSSPSTPSASRPRR